MKMTLTFLIVGSLAFSQRQGGQVGAVRGAEILLPRFTFGFSALGRAFSLMTPGDSLPEFVVCDAFSGFNASS